MKFQISKTELEEIFQFSTDFIQSGKSGLDFGNSELQRGDIDKIADVAEGKIGELVFKKFCDSHNVEIGLDFKITPGKHAIDFGQDVEGVKINGEVQILIPRIDIKTSRSYSNWLLLEDHKLWASIIVFVTVNLPKNTEQNLDAFFSQPISGEFRGFIYWFDLFDEGNQPWFEYTNQEPKNRLLNPIFVKQMFLEAEKDDRLVRDRKQLVETFHKVKSDFSHEKIFIGGPLKCPRQYGLPVFLIRKNEQQIKDLMSIISNLVVPQDTKGVLTDKR